MNEPRSQDDVMVAKWMRQLAAMPLTGPPLLDPQILLWKAQAARHLDQQQQITHALDATERIEMIGGSCVAVALVVWLSIAMPEFWTMPLFVVAMIVSSALVIAAAALMTWNVEAYRDK